MSSFLFVLSVLLSASALSSVLVAWFAWQQRAKPSAMPMFALGLAISVWTICYIFEINSADLPTKLFWSSIKYPAVVIIPISLAVFLLRFAGWTSWPKPWLLICLLILPAITIFFVFTNQYHQLFWTSTELQTFPNYVSLKATYGPWFEVFTLYSYVSILMSSTLALSSLARSWNMYSRQILWLAIGICLPLIANLISILGFQPWPGIDLSPMAFGVGALFLLTSNGLTGILDVSPLAHVALMEQIRDGVLVLDRENRVHELNQAAEQILMHSHKELTGKNIFSIRNPAVEMLRLYLGGNTTQRDVQINTLETSNWYDMRISKILASQGEMVGRLVVWREITERKKIENELRFTSSHDQLTGLYNRMYFETEFLRLQLGRDWPITILMIDLDLLKQTNDKFGHAAGDELIRQTADIMRSVFRKDDLVARIGGDEFSALLPKCDKNNAKMLVERLYKAMESSNESHTEHRVSFSIGFETAESGDDLSQTMLAADTNLYAEKAQRKRRS